MREKSRFPEAGSSVKVIAKLALTVGMSLILHSSMAAAYSGPDYTQYAIPSTYGQTFGGANVPFGYLLINHENWYWAGNWDYTRPVLKYDLFALSGAQMDDVRMRTWFAPFLGDPSGLGCTGGPSFQRNSVAGFHHITYTQPASQTGLDVAIAARTHAGLCRFSFPSGKSFGMIIWQRSGTVRLSGTNEVTVDGNWCPTVYQFKQPVKALKAITLSKTAVISVSASTSSVQCGVMDTNTLALVEFATDGMTAIDMKVGIGWAGLTYARQHVQSEITGWDILPVADSARAQWNEHLSRIAVEGSDDAKRKFYSNLFLAISQPNLCSEPDGAYRYCINDPGWHLPIQWGTATAQGYSHYANFSGWDVWRSQFQLLGAVYAGEANDMARSLTVDGQRRGRLPVWSWLTSETGCMGTWPGINMVAELNQFGAWNWAGKTDALKLMCADTSNILSTMADASRDGSLVVEGAASFFHIAQFAASLGDTALYRRMLKHANEWKKYFNSNGIIRNGFSEGDRSDYSWMITYNMKDLIATMGGGATAEAKMDQANAYDGIGNEPQFHLPFLYNWIGKPWKTQEKVHWVLSGHLGGDEDLGAISSWTLWGMLGIYPAIYAVPGFTLHGPSLTKEVIRFSSGKVLAILAPAASATNYCIQSVTLNGQDYQSTWLPMSSLDRDSNTLVFTMGGQPNTGWGSRPQDAPPSFDENSAPTALMTAAPLNQSGACMHLSIRSGHTLDIAIADAGPHEIHIYRGDGSIVRSIRGAGEQRHSISRSLLPADFYIVEAVSGQGRMVRPIAMP